MDAVNGTAGNDTISGLVGVSGTFNVGDTISGGAGTDTLNLNVQSGGQAQLVSLSGVENVNARLLEAGPGSALALNAIDWAGVTTLSFNNSLDETSVRVSGLTTEASIAVQREVDVSVDFRALTSGTDAVSLTLTSAGSGGGTAASLGSAGVADIDVDLDNAGLIDTLNVNLAAGTNYATLEAGADLRTLNITGAGNAYLSTDDAITSLDASAASGNLDITLTGASEVVAKGGAGNDTLRLGTTISNNDSFDGGAGTDSIRLTMGGFNRSLNTTNVESATITFGEAAGGALNVSASTVTAITVLGSAADTDANITQIANGATVTIGSDALDYVALDTVSGAQTLSINVGTATAGLSLSAGLAVSDVAAVTIAAVSGSAGTTIALGTATFDADVKSVSLSNPGDADVTVTDLHADAATSVSIVNSGSGDITFTSGIEAGTALVSVSVQANGGTGGDVVLASLNGSGSGLSFNSLALNGTNGSDITVGAVSMGNGVTAAGVGTITMLAGNNSIVGTTALDVTVTGNFALTLDLEALATGTVAIGDINLVAGTASTAASAQTVIISDVAVAAAGSVSVEKIAATGATAGAQIVIGAITVGTSGGFSLGASGGIDVGTAATGRANVDVSDITITLGADASANFGTILTTGGVVGAITQTVADSASANMDAINASGIGAITVTVSGDGESDFGGFTAVSNIGAITLSIADEGDVTVGAVSAGGDIESIAITNGASGTANFGTIDASSIGSITVNGAGFVDFGTISAAAIAGGVNASTMTSGTFNIDLSGVDSRVEVSLGAATNVVISGKDNDTITLKAGSTGNDNIQYGTATQGTDLIVNFNAGSTGGDQIEFATGVLIMNGSATKTDATTVLLTTASANGAITVAGTGAVAAHAVVITSTAFASEDAMVSAIATGGSLEIGVASGESTAGALIIVWTDGTDTYVSLATAAAGKSGADAIITGTADTIAQLQGVTPGAIVAANFDFV